jgi:N-acetylmuramic acid 6-phosphate etherase
MVDMQATNSKLRGRARRIVAEVCEMSEEQAGKILSAAGGELKTAIVMARAGVTAEAARERLARSGGVVREALEGERDA